MNEALSRALLRARLTDEDVAARLQVDPKTVRRWLDGRLPYLRHRWALAQLVGVDESDLWPQLRSARSRPAEVIGVYAHRDLVPPQTWLRLFSSASEEAGVMADAGFLLADGSAILHALAGRARRGVRVRVCVAGPARPPGLERGRERDSLVAAIGNTAAPAEVRVDTAPGYNSICYADRQLLVAQHVYGLPAGQAPVLHLDGAAAQDMAAAYLASFERAWAGAVPVS
ncbi:MAG TPA: XRE family transcriptional regulator [Streptosporangiaceae bacterium]|nr:XRE family transcriptional regulator [Streptosporangiaceae bacterium]